VATSERTVDLIFLLYEAARSLETEMAVGLEAVGATPRTYCVLSKALEAECSQIDLAKRAGLDKTTMVVTLDELEQAGLAERRPSPTDRRARVIAVTDKGAEMVARGREVVDGLYADVLATLPEESRATFVDGLARLVEERLANPPQCEKPVRRRRGSP
jgi:DNA-binding MarR family transcriptional regulator